MKVRLGDPALGAQELQAVAEVLETGMLTMGPKVPEFEALVARACGVEHAVAVSSGTAALHLAVLALGLEPGDEVLVPAYTFPATANVVALSGARPVLIDVDPHTLNLDPAKLDVGPRTKAILAVHLFG
ncbi:MAG TPA: aminotransferase class I/II-fold pyridoxal phosphate-dependent enzyme, partial [Gaiellaceae bacterium]|nr:aminotransferase class I/II-fold pyridoxal phosphate-dependent enzyme [Gaiellaceae bacterium]